MSFRRKLVVPTTPYVPSPFPDAMNSAEGR